MYEADQRLVAKLLEGDQQCFREFFDAYAQRLAAFVMRRTGGNMNNTEDIVQVSMIRAIRGLKNFRGDASLFTWLCTICRSEIADQRRKSGRQVPVVSMDAEPGVTARVAQLQAADEYMFPPSDSMVSHADSISAVFAQLPERYCRILEMKYGDELSVVEMSYELGLTAAATQSLLARARDAFRDAWSSVQEQQTISGRQPTGTRP